MRALFACVLLLALLPGVAATPIESYAVRFELASSGSAQETVSVGFAEPLAAAQRFTLMASDMADGAVRADGLVLQTNLSAVAGGVELAFVAPKGTKRIEARFRTHGVVFSGADSFQFFTNLRPPKEVSQLTTIVLLPPGHVLYRGINPASGVKGSDGTRITVSWAFAQPAGPLPLSLQYRREAPEYTALIALLVIGIGVAAAAGWFFARRRSERAFLFTFFEDERSVLLAIRAKKVAYQNTLERQFGFSRAKMTRIAQKLERRGLVKKERAGRTNRLVWRGPLFHTVSFAPFRRETNKRPLSERGSE